MRVFCWSLVLAFAGYSVGWYSCLYQVELYSWLVARYVDFHLIITGLF